MATITPEEQEQERLQQAANDQLFLAQQDSETIDANQIDFGHAKYSKKDVPVNWFLKKFLEGENEFNPDFR